MGRGFRLGTEGQGQGSGKQCTPSPPRMQLLLLVGDLFPEISPGDNESQKRTFGTFELKKNVTAFLTPIISCHPSPLIFI